jgi:hypothetical protein
MIIEVRNWKYDDGWYDILKMLQKDGIEREFLKECVGWHCWVYTDNDREFCNWMHENMQGKYEAIQRFNSGDPMVTVRITDSADAAVFKLKFM